MEKLEKMIVENGITYVLGEDDIYYPDLQLPEGMVLCQDLVQNKMRGSAS